MYNEKTRKVMIVDDERLVRVGLMRTVDWKRWNLQVVADAPNGTIAWEMFRKYRPELVITDIVMPGMGGIELTEKIKAEEPTTKVVFLSCHRDFSYAQQGIELGASGYVLKTAMGDHEIDLCLAKLQGEWEREPSDSSADGERSSALFAAWLNGDADGEAVRSKLEVSTPQLEQQKVILYVECSADEAEDHSHAGSELAMAAAFSVRLSLSCGLTGRLHLVYADRAGTWQQRLLQRNIADSSYRWKKSEPVCGIDSILNTARRLVRSIELEQRYGMQSESLSKPVIDALQYIEQHLHEPLQSATLADEVGLSRSHFCTVFKKETGVSFLQYLHQQRLEKACRLLKGTEWKMAVIGEKIGMPDDKHFSKWFKKHTSVTPTGYRARNR